MRKPTEIETLYLDFDGFFASVHQQADKRLRGRPVGVVPFEGTTRTCVIACSREAKMRGIKSVMNVLDAKRQCPGLILIPQQPDLYRRAHNALLAEISAVLPIEAVKSIDELVCTVAPADRADPQALGHRIKRRIAENIGPAITCSIGFAANRQLAKMACKAGKRVGGFYGDGLTVWAPAAMPGPLLPIALKDVPGVGRRMFRRLATAGIVEMAQLLATQPKQMRALWRNVTGERLWYALHGYALQTPPSGRSMYGHGRVLPPEARNADAAREISRLLMTKAARRLRRDGWYAGTAWLSLETKRGALSRSATLPAAHDYQAVLAALEEMWDSLVPCLTPREPIFRVHIALLDLTPASERQLDLLADDDPARVKWDAVSEALDRLNGKYGATVVSLGAWRPPAGGHAGGKISYTRIPRAEDFW
ncbi:MAG: type VI secretion protein ImpB [Alphaproteobacteria bacterium]